MRLDKYLSEKFGTRSKAAAAIGRGAVLVNGSVRDAAYNVKGNDIVTLTDEKICFVSAGGYKLHKALHEFGFSVKDKVFADIGASTGGFTDCLLKEGAKKIYCIDVGVSQLDVSLRDKNVVVIDGFNARALSGELFDEQIDGITIDVSFISLTYILEAASKVLCPGGHIIALIKPQFECGDKNVGKKGIVRDPEKHRVVIRKIYDFALNCRLKPLALTTAPEIKGKNLEYVILLEKDGAGNVPIENLIAGVKL